VEIAYVIHVREINYFRVVAVGLYS